MLASNPCARFVSPRVLHSRLKLLLARSSKRIGGISGLVDVTVSYPTFWEHETARFLETPRFYGAHKGA
jgi:hypothetical protein